MAPTQARHVTAMPRMLLSLSLFLSLLGLARLASAVELPEYDFVVVGSGPGGGPLAARLAMAGHRTLLIEAGDDQGPGVNYSVPAYSAKSSEDEALAWNFFVRHYGDDSRQARDPKTSYRTPDGQIYTGLNPPQGSAMMGTLYPRTGTLGGCSAHHALVTIYPHRSDFDYIADLTGDESWRPNNMRRYFERLEDNQYLLPGTRGHGFDGWLSVDKAPIDLAIADAELLSLILGGSTALASLTNTIHNLETLIAGDANADTAARDSSGGYYQTPLSTKDGRRTGSREFVVSVRDAKNPDGSKRWPLDVRTNCYVTKIMFDRSSEEPRAIGVEFLDGAYLYRASPRSNPATKGELGCVRAKHEVIIAGGAYNSPQILKVSGVGPKDELSRLGIDVVKDLPGVGTNLQDHYEVAVQGDVPLNFSILNGCTFTSRDDDPCLRRWQRPLPFIGNRGVYSSNGLPVSMLFRSSVSTEYDAFVFGGPVDFRGYFPGYSINITANHRRFTWAVLKGHPRNTAGSVKLRSADPLDVPDISYNYFDAGSGDSAADLRAIREAIQLARSAFARQLLTVNEVLPGGTVQSDEQLDTYIKDTAWGHHASSTCPIGADTDPSAVLDSQFRVRGIKGLRVVDASVYPRIPGTFTAVSTYMVSEKAADVILAQYRQA